MTWTLRFIHLIPVFGLAVFGLIWAGTENLIKIERIEGNR